MMYKYTPPFIDDPRQPPAWLSLALLIAAFLVGAWIGWMI